MVNIESVYAFLDEGYTHTKLKDIQNAINFNDHPAVLKLHSAEATLEMKLKRTLLTTLAKNALKFCLVYVESRTSIILVIFYHK